MNQVFSNWRLSPSTLLVFIIFGKFLFLPILSFLPIATPTLGIILLIVAIILFLAVSVKNRFRKLKFGYVWFLLFCLFLLPFYGYFFLDIHQGLFKVKYLLLIYNVIAYLALISIVRLVWGRKSIVGLEWNLILFSRLTLILYLIFYFGGAYVIGDTGRLTIDGTINPIWTARYLGAAIVVLFILGSKIDFILIAGGIGIILLTGSRAPLLSILMTIGLCTYHKFSRSHWVRYSSYTALIAIAIYILLFDVQLIGPTDYSGLTRLNYLKLIAAKGMTLSGYGFGNFGFVMYGIEKGSYPHNLFAEFYFEGGLISLGIFVLIIVRTYTKAIRNITLYLFIFFFINSNFTGDMVSNSELFALVWIINLFSSKI